MNDLRTAAQAAQPEPAAWYFERGTDRGISFAPDRDPDKTWRPLYLAPQPQRKPLTEEEIDALPNTDGEGSDWEALVQFARLIERAHGIGE